MKDWEDSLHVPSADLIVIHKGKETILLNKELLDQQNAWENLELIKELHSRRLYLCDKMFRARSEKSLRMYDEEYTQIEFQLQDAWKFDRDIRFHRFWERPKCECPKMDNADSYPSGYYVVTASCKLHYTAEGL